jgi:hypothetical protein
VENAAHVIVNHATVYNVQPLQATVMGRSRQQVFGGRITAPVIAAIDHF